VLEIETSCFLLWTIANPKQTNGLLAQDMLEYSYNLVLSNKSKTSCLNVTSLVSNHIS
jgi:hypothetical protein